MKRLFALLCGIVFCTAAAVPALAAQSQDGYAITRYSVDATLHANNTVTQTETLDVRFDEPRHGIYRSLPQTVSVEKRTADGSRMMNYRVRIRDISVEGAPFSRQSEDGMLILRIGDKDKLVSGAQTYTIRFTYDIGDDRVDSYDELFYTLNGPGWEVPIEAFSYRMTFEKALPDDALAGLSILSGPYGSHGNSADVSLQADAHSASGAAGRALQPGEAVTLYAPLPEGYFTGERTAVLWPFYVLLVLCAALGLFTVAMALAQRRRKARSTECHAAPDDLSSAEVGYLIDGSADDRDLLSLILWFAQKGYLALSPDEWDGDDPARAPLVLTRRRALPPGAPSYQRTLFDGLFHDGATFHLDDPAPGFYDALQQAKRELAAEFEGERALYERSSVFESLVLPLLCCALWLAGASGAGAFITARSVGLGLLSSLPLLVLVVLMRAAASRWQFAHAGVRAVWTAGLAIVCAGTGVAAWLASADALVPRALVLGAYCVTLAACLFAPRIVRPTAYQVQQSGALLGLYRFIAGAKQEQLAPLLDEDPTYFYDVLPYAYVFGLANEWAGLFEPLALEPPAWYPNYYGPFYVAAFSRSMYTGFEHSLARSYEAHAAASGAGRSDVSGGGGSFSGGGFGGGGGGSW